MAFLWEGLGFQLTHLFYLLLYEYGLEFSRARRWRALLSSILGYAGTTSEWMSASSRKNEVVGLLVETVGSVAVEPHRSATCFVGETF